MHNLMRRMLLWIVGPKQFVCGPTEQCIEFVGKYRRRARIWVKQPDGDMKLQYQYWLASKLSESQLRDIEEAPDKMERAHKYKREERDFLFFDKVFSRCDAGYVDDKGHPINDLSTDEQIQYLKKWFPDHVEKAIYFAFDDAIGDALCKKKA